jgi:hypothetical protein
MKRRRNRNTPRDTDRKHLTGLQMERLIGATRGDRNEARDRCLLLLMFPRSPGLGSLPVEARPAGHARPRPANRPIEGIDHAALARRRAARDRRMTETTRPHETGRQELLCQRAAAGVAPRDRQPRAYFTRARLRKWFCGQAGAQCPKPLRREGSTGVSSCFQPSRFPAICRGSVYTFCLSRRGRGRYGRPCCSRV